MEIFDAESRRDAFVCPYFLRLLSVSVISSEELSWSRTWRLLLLLTEAHFEAWFGWKVQSMVMYWNEFSLKAETGISLLNFTVNALSLKNIVQTYLSRKIANSFLC